MQYADGKRHIHAHTHMLTQVGMLTHSCSHTHTQASRHARTHMLTHAQVAMCHVGGLVNQMMERGGFMSGRSTLSFQFPLY